MHVLVVGKFFECLELVYIIQIHCRLGCKFKANCPLVDLSLHWESPPWVFYGILSLIYASFQINCKMFNIEGGVSRASGSYAATHKTILIHGNLQTEAFKCMSKMFAPH